MLNLGQSFIKPARWPLQPRLTAAPELWRDVFGVYPVWGPETDQLVDISGQGHTAPQAGALSYTTSKYGLAYRTTDRIGLQALETDLDKYAVSLLTVLNRVYVTGDQGFFDTRGSLRGVKSQLTNSRRLTCSMGVDGPSGFTGPNTNISANGDGNMPVVMRWWKGSDNHGYLDIKAANGDQASGVSASEIYDLQHQNNLFADHREENYESLRVIWNRRITDAERELVLRDPFAMIRPGPQAIPTLFSGAGATGATVNFSGTLAATSVTIPALAVTRTLSAQSDSTSTVSAALGRLRALSAGIASVSSTDSAVAVTRGLTASVAGVSTVSAALSRLKDLSAGIASVSTADGTLAVMRGLSAPVTSSSSVDASLGRIRPFAATIGSVSTTDATANVTRSFAATTAGTSTIAASLAVVAAGVTSFSATLANTSGLSAGIAVLRRLRADIASTSAANASLTVIPLSTVSFTGTISSASSASSAIRVQRAISGQIASVSQVTANLSGVGQAIIDTVNLSASYDLVLNSSASYDLTVNLKAKLGS